jgi:hypothetical protein
MFAPEALFQLNSHGFKSIEEALPEIGERVLALTSGYQCLAYRSPEGEWRTASSDAPIETVLAWAPVGKKS